MRAVQINRVCIVMPDVPFEDQKALIVNDLEEFRTGLAEQLGVESSQVRINYTEKDEEQKQKI